MSHLLKRALVFVERLFSVFPKPLLVLQIQIKIHVMSVVNNKSHGHEELKEIQNMLLEYETTPSNI